MVKCLISLDPTNHILNTDFSKYPTDHELPIVTATHLNDLSNQVITINDQNLYEVPNKINNNESNEI